MPSSGWVAIQRNPVSGSGRRGPLLDFIAALKRHGLRPRLFSRRDRFDQMLSSPELREGLHAIVAAGGDGTILDVINRHPDVPVGILPLGTENLLARYFGIPRDAAGAARVVAEGCIQSLDLGFVGQRRFAIMASCGFDADVIHRLHAARTGNIRYAHYVQPIWGSLRTYAHPEIRVFADDAEEPVAGRMVVVANLAAYAFRLGVVPTARGDDGLLDVRVFQRGSAVQMLRYVWQVYRGRHELLPDVVALRAQRVRIESSSPIPIQIDGDPAGLTPAEITVQPAAARIFVPATYSPGPKEPLSPQYS